MDKRNTVLLWVVLILLVVGLVKCQFHIGPSYNTTTSWTQSVSDMDNGIPVIPRVPAIPDLTGIIDSAFSQIESSQVRRVDLMDSISTPIVIHYNSPQKIGNMNVSKHILYPRDYKGAVESVDPDSSDAIFLDVICMNNSRTSINIGVYRKVKLKAMQFCNLTFPYQSSNGVKLLKDTFTLRNQTVEVTKGLSIGKNTPHSKIQGDFRESERLLILKALKIVQQKRIDKDTENLNSIQ